MTVHELIRALSVLETRVGGGTDVMIAMSDGGEWNVSHAEAGIDSDGCQVIAIIPKED